MKQISHFLLRFGSCRYVGACVWVWLHIIIAKSEILIVDYAVMGAEMKKQNDNNNMEMIIVMIIEKENDYQLNYPQRPATPEVKSECFICVYC